MDLQEAYAEGRVVADGRGSYRVKHPFSGEYEPLDQYVTTDLGHDFAKCARATVRQPLPWHPRRNVQVQHANLWPHRKLRIWLIPGFHHLWTTGLVNHWYESCRIPGEDEDTEVEWSVAVEFSVYGEGTDTSYSQEETGIGISNGVVGNILRPGR